MALVNVVKHESNAQELVGKYTEDDIRIGSQLIVYPSQTAFFVKGGKILDTFTSGTYTLNSENIPLLNKVINLPFGKESPFGAEVWFVNQIAILDRKWGTAAPIQIEDPKYGVIVPVLARGQYGFRISDPRLFLESFVGNMPSFAPEILCNYFLGVIQSKLSTIIAEALLANNASVVNINSRTEAISEFAQQKLQQVFANYGVELLLFTVVAISVQESDPSFQRLKKAIDTSAEMRIIGQGNYQMKRSFDVLEKAAENTGGGTMNAAVGLGAGLNIGNQMGNLVTQSMNTHPIPPVPPQPQYYVVINGVQQGPYDLNAMQNLFQQGSINSNTLVWAAGMAQWTPLNTVPALANLQANTPPPIPNP